MLQLVVHEGLTLLSSWWPFAKVPCHNTMYWVWPSSPACSLSTYLRSRALQHKDLTHRNILVCHQPDRRPVPFAFKVSDFGTSCNFSTPDQPQAYVSGILELHVHASNQNETTVPRAQGVQVKRTHDTGGWLRCLEGKETFVFQYVQSFTGSRAFTTQASSHAGHTRELLLLQIFVTLRPALKDIVLPLCTLDLNNILIENGSVMIDVVSYLAKHFHEPPGFLFGQSQSFAQN
ncbi:hypothetical protein GOODEAATRI_025330 [Goodea atripinnis]|uniref:Protein kinase domain-containing protein n=1 Tax=Goodea atripinnis TaxID=208336 RepID=A0ABV0PH81_9TELE